MNRIRIWVRAVLGFSRGESNAFIVLLPLLIIIIFAVPIYRSLIPSPPEDYSSHQRYLDSLVSTWQWEKKDSITIKSVSLFRFDPNTATLEELKTLGLNASIAQRIINYRSKGGKFIVKNDLRKVYGLDSTWFKGIVAYINLPDTKPELPKFEPRPAEVKKEKVAFDINAADTTQLIALYGIGPKLALRIVKYRDKLGGFIHMDQVKEVYGLDSAIVSRLKEMTFIDRNFVPARLNINQLTEKELAAHPYLNWKIAKAIAAYRFQHGVFKSLDDLGQVKLLDEHTRQRISPYLTLE